jgi:uncharacterized membrane protein
MENEKREKLEERVDRLEQEVKQLRTLLQKQSHDDAITITSEGDAAGQALDGKDMQPDLEGKPQESKPLSERITIGENWLQRIGIGLLLLGVAFLFKYSIDQGWLVPPIRSLIGLGIGLALFVPGLQFSDEQTPLKQILLGGGIATFYITGFATFQLYSFVPSPVIWLFMVVVTLLALSLALQQNEAVLSIVGTLGGLATPFMLYTGSGSLSSLMVYTSLILTGAAVIYFIKAWRSLLWTMVLGGWLVFLVGLFNNILEELSPIFADRLTLQLGLLFGLAVFWLVPVVREIVSRRSPKQWPHPTFKNIDGSVDENVMYVANASTQLMVLAIPVLSVLYSMALWDISWEAWGVIAMALSLVLGYGYMPLRREELPGLASVHGFSALILLTLSFFLLFEGPLLFTIIALEGLGLRIVAQQNGDERISTGSHILFGLAAIWLFHNFTDYNTPEWAILNLNALAQLLIILIAGIGVPYWLNKQSSRQTYRLLAHIGLLAWFYSELFYLENGQAYVSVCWAIYAISLLIYGFSRESRSIRMAAMATVFLVVAKLFLIDLSQLQAIWRILLFIGFGALFLFISYYLQRRFSEAEADEIEESTESMN